MKPVLVFLFIVFGAFGANSQSLFFDHCKKTPWVCGEEYNDSAFCNATGFGLTKCTVPLDSLPDDMILWRFEEKLVISQYIKSTNTEKVLNTYRYELHHDKGTIKIWIDPHTVHTFKVGVVSTGTFAGLTKV